MITKATASALGLDLTSFESSQTALVSSQNARRYDPDQLALVEDDKRLIKAVRALEGYELSYGFFEGRLYVAVIAWSEGLARAKDNAQKAGGYLATLTSKAENQFVYDLVVRDDRFWKIEPHWATGPVIGLLQTPGAREPDGGWSWITGEPLSYRNWIRGNPTNKEQANIAGFGRHMPASRYYTGTDPDGTWVDYANVYRSFIIEIE